MTIAKYTCLRFAVYFFFFAFLVIACGRIWPESMFGHWHVVTAFGIVFGAVEVYLQLTLPQLTQCLRKEDWHAIHQRLRTMGYKPTERTVDSLIFFRKVGFISWERIRVMVKQNHIHIEIPEEHEGEFDQWLSDGSCG